jgi:acetyl-CoA carboxylase biotin carboxyl carrier protein
MDFKTISRLIRMVESHNIEELEIHDQGFEVRIAKAKQGHGDFVHTTAKPTMHIPSAPGSPALPAEAQASAPAPASLPAAPPAAAAPPSNIVEICSPMVGTFYRSSAPDAKTYVEVGDTIRPGQILCIVEAMKLMNEIEAEITGKVTKILVENAHPVEYNQPLFLVEKT